MDNEYANMFFFLFFLFLICTNIFVPFIFPLFQLGKQSVTKRQEAGRPPGRKQKCGGDSSRNLIGFHARL